MKQNAPQDAHLAERKSSLRDPLGRERVASDSFLLTGEYYKWQFTLFRIYMDIWTYF